MKPKSLPEQITDLKRRISYMTVVNFDSGELYVRDLAELKRQLAALEAERVKLINSPEFLSQ